MANHIQTHVEKGIALANLSVGAILATYFHKRIVFRTKVVWNWKCTSVLGSGRPLASNVDEDNTLMQYITDHTIVSAENAIFRHLGGQPKEDFGNMKF